MLSGTLSVQPHRSSHQNEVSYFKIYFLPILNRSLLWESIDHEASIKWAVKNTLDFWNILTLARCTAWPNRTRAAHLHPPLRKIKHNQVTYRYLVRIQLSQYFLALFNPRGRQLENFWDWDSFFSKRGFGIGIHFF